jgi:tetratricopeptide (TPR) repeat protein
MDADTLLADAARRKKVEDDLRRLGASPDEVRRLLNADAHSVDPLSRPATTTAPTAASKLPLPPTVAARGRARRVAADSLNGFAAELMSQRSAAQVKAVEEAERRFPPFRPSSPQEIRQSEQLLRDAASLRRREKYAEAEAKCREALDLVPKDAAGLELLGDLLQGIARIDEALAAYKRAVEADPKRASAERKLADLLVQQQQWNGPDPEAAPKKPYVAVFLSLIPGLGQFHNGDTGKGLFFLAADAGCYYLIAQSPWGAAGHHVAHRFDFGWLACLTATAVVVLAAGIDAAIVAKNGGARPRSGWDV